MSSDGFSIEMKNCRSYNDDFSYIEQKLEKSKEQIINIANNLESTTSLRFFKINLIALASQIERERRSISTMHRTLYQAIEYYHNTENSIIGNIENNNMEGVGSGSAEGGFSLSSFWEFIKKLFGWNKDVSEYEIDSVVFDDVGAYGGDQGEPKSITGKEKDEIYNIVREYYPDMSDLEISNYLKKLNSEGCGYVAVINTIFAAYEGREKEFEETFGFPMYENGDLNYNKLLVDFYSATDNHNLGKDGMDYIKYDEDTSDTNGVGTSQYDRKYRTEMYLSDKNVNVNIATDYKVTTENFEKLSEEGYVIIAYRYGNLQNADGTTAQYINGGHAMVVTGVTEDGRYVVSSWGDKYYIDPNQIIKEDGNSTSFTFSYYQYNN